MQNWAQSNSFLLFLYKLPISFYVALFTSFFFSLIIIKTIKSHQIFTLDSPDGVQKIHVAPTPRIGGLAVFFAVICAYFSEQSERILILGPIILAGLSAFIFGLIEDITKKVSISIRFFATTLSGVIGWSITGISLTHIGVPFLAPLFDQIFFSVIFTTLAVGGLANAINIIDGLNGLASSMMIIALVCISAIANSVGDMNLAIASLTVGAAIFGFFIVNWPWGKIFMGDGGSYFGGFALAWSCVLLVERNPLVSPFTGLLLCVYPFTETVFSIIRRSLKTKEFTKPDALHLHSLIYMRYFATKHMRVGENSITGILIGTLSIPPAVCAYCFSQNNLLCFLSVIFFISAYLAVYSRVVRFRWF
jgi:UDP-N-acetylmuramyl pentapeptide phosphotransferase/UDP-N-acetylglucosamine-1-phosphate transferase